MMKIDFVKKWEWMSAYSKRRCRRLFFRTRAALKKGMKNNGWCKGKEELTFQYDPSSYALNFDDGCCNLYSGDEDSKSRSFELPSCCHGGKTRSGLVLVIVLWVNPIAI